MLTRNMRRQMEKEKNAMPSDRASLDNLLKEPSSKRTREQRKRSKPKQEEKSNTALSGQAMRAKICEESLSKQPMKQKETKKVTMPSLMSSMYGRGKRMKKVEKRSKPKQEEKLNTALSDQAMRVKTCEESLSKQHVEQKQVEPHAAGLKLLDEHINGVTGFLGDLNRQLDIWDSVKHKLFEKYNVDPSTISYIPLEPPPAPGKKWTDFLDMPREPPPVPGKKWTDFL